MMALVLYETQFLGVLKSPGVLSMGLRMGLRLISRFFSKRFAHLLRRLTSFIARIGSLDPL